MPNENRKAAANELRDFLAQIRGKSPKEMLGTIASSNLAQSAITATAAITIAVVALTIIPFALNKAFAKADPSTTEAPATPTDKTPLATPAEPTLDISADKRDAAAKLGIGESKDAPTNVNPLESSTGDLLDGLE